MTDQSNLHGTQQDADQMIIVIKAEYIARALGRTDRIAEQVRLLNLQSAGGVDAHVTKDGDVELYVSSLHTGQFTLSARFSDSSERVFEETFVVDVSRSALVLVGESADVAFSEGPATDREGAGATLDGALPLAVSCQPPAHMRPESAGQWTDGILELQSPIAASDDFMANFIAYQFIKSVPCEQTGTLDGVCGSDGHFANFQGNLISEASFLSDAHTHKITVSVFGE